MKRTSTARWRVSPTRRIFFSSRTRRSLDGRGSGRSPISSRKNVPPEASSMRPDLSRTAPVKEPRAWPKSSLSRSASGMAAQLTATNGPPRPRPRRTPGAVPPQEVEDGRHGQGQELQVLPVEGPAGAVSGQVDDARGAAPKRPGVGQDAPGLAVAVELEVGEERLRGKGPDKARPAGPGG